ncbi:MAG: AEC family transporter [Clostridiales bacterium]|nr:AEC family transporter [Clostridiales bacterium]
MQQLALTSLNQIIIMFLIIIIGIICYKIKLIDNDMNKKLSDVVLMLINPLVLFVSYQREFEKDLLQGLIISIILAVIIHVLGIIISICLIRGKDKKDKISIERFAAIYSNCGFIGIPLANGLFGGEGVFYIAAYVTVFNIFLWTHGVIVMTGRSDWKALGKAILSPTIIATIIGVVLFILQIKLPNPMFEAFNYIASMNTPMAMLVSGVTIAQTNVLKLFIKPRMYYLTFVKLLVIPVLVMLIFSLFSIPEVVSRTSILAVSTPTAVSVTLFSLRYGKDHIYSSEIFAMTTIFSAITIPLIMAIADMIL